MSTMIHTDLIQNYYDALTPTQRRFLSKRVLKLQPTNRSEEDKLIADLNWEYNIYTNLLREGLVPLTESLLDTISLRKKIAAGGSYHD